MEKYSNNKPQAELPAENRIGKTIAAVVLGSLSALYILNPTAGIIELLPDNIPFLGNLDEATAVIILVACLRHFGLDITKFLKLAKHVENAPVPSRGEKVVSPVDPEVEAARQAMYAGKR